MVEDEDRVRSLAGRILQINGLIILDVRSREETLDVCRQHRGLVHVVVTDVMLPGMRGPELVERLTDVYPQLRAVFISGLRGCAACSTKGRVVPPQALFARRLGQGSVSGHIRRCFIEGKAVSIQEKGNEGHFIEGLGLAYGSGTGLKVTAPAQSRTGAAQPRHQGIQLYPQCAWAVVHSS